MAVPKRHLSKARRDKRRSNVWKLEAPALVKCSNCGSLKLPHQACGNCGYYRARKSSRRANLRRIGGTLVLCTEGEGAMPSPSCFVLKTKL